MRPVFLSVFLLLPLAALADTGLTSPEPLAENIAAFPRLTASDAAAQKVNAALAALEADTLAGLRDCDGSRDVRVTLISPRYYSLFAAAGGMCAGAAHPFYDQMAMTFDLTTGAQVDWAQLLPKSLLDPDSDDYDPGYPLRSQALAAAYLAALPERVPDCEAAYAGPLDFSFWLDGEKQALAMMPSDLPYADMACGETVYLPVAQLSGFGFDGAVIAALQPQP